MSGIIKKMLALALISISLNGCKHYAVFPEMEKNEGVLISDQQNIKYDDSTPIIGAQEIKKAERKVTPKAETLKHEKIKLKEPEPQKPAHEVMPEKEKTDIKKGITDPAQITSQTDKKQKITKDLSKPDSQVEDIPSNDTIYVVPDKTTPSVITDMDLTEMDAESSKGKSKSKSKATEVSKSAGIGAKPKSSTSTKQETKKASTPAKTEEPSVYYLAETIYFNNGGSAVDSKYFSSLRKIVKEAKSHNGKIIVQGFASSRTRNTDMITHKMANLKVSIARAENVANQLAQYGMPRSKIITEGLSDSRPAYQEVMPEGERLNRRAEIYISY